MANRTRFKSLDKVAADPRVIDIDVECGVSDSRYTYSITLCRGWICDGVHYPCENSIRALLTTFSMIQPCTCAECEEPD